MTRHLCSYPQEKTPPNWLAQWAHLPAHYPAGHRCRFQANRYFRREIDRRQAFGGTLRRAATTARGSISGCGSGSAFGLAISLHLKLADQLLWLVRRHRRNWHC